MGGGGAVVAAPPRGRWRCAAGLLLVLAAGTVEAQEPRLGAIEFGTSASGEAQRLFVRGVLYLHSFEFDDAAEAFRQAQAADAGFAMAYWGEAMAYNHPLWGEWDDAAARAVLARLGPTPDARRAKAPTERERMYLDAVEALWADGPKPVRDTAYALAMEDLARRYPDDVEARAFHALSLMGLSGTVRVVPTYVRAGAIALQILGEHPRHPGAAHYVIHAFDDPTHAPIALPAARAYSTIAPDAAHAQHMTTHIFVAMGMWDDVVSQNVVAANLTWWGPGHYSSWLTYGLAQAGRFAEAERYLVGAQAALADRSSPGSRSYLATMRAHHVVNTERWDDPSLGWKLDLEETWPVARGMDAFAVGYAALHRGEIRVAESSLERLQQVLTEHPDDGKLQVMRLELEAALVHRAGKVEHAVALLRAATSIEDRLPAEYGPPDIVKPSHELLGELLLAEGDGRAAQREFERALALAPKRARALLGLGRAALAAGDAPAATRAYATLADIWHGADETLPERTEAQRLASDVR
jgi:tetratricopeptide (TPR) repeat protein